MTASDILRRRAEDYSLKYAHAAEQDEAQVAAGEFPSPEPMLLATVSLVLREVADALEAQYE